MRLRQWMRMKFLFQTLTVMTTTIFLWLCLMQEGNEHRRTRRNEFKRSLLRNLRPPETLIRTLSIELEDDLISWEDEYAYVLDMAREGLGEHGKGVNATDIERNEIESAYRMYSYNAPLSRRISLNRSLPDLRHPECKITQYKRSLPSVSVIIPFHNEHWTVLLRTCYGIVNRSPPALIKEIILVDDASTVESLGDKLDDYVTKHLPKVRIVRLKERSGLIVARLVGCKYATAEVLLFLDAHVEPNYNWLPPLLDPIARNPKTCVCPQVDLVKYDTFEYIAADNGKRGIFTWHFFYTRLPLFPDDVKNLPKPFKSPIMYGGLFAIRKDFFWELGGYDEGLDIWGGEQFEISFKIWMCGGVMLDAPCSRFGHVFPAPGKYDVNPRKNDYLHKNFKRVAEVWMDEYKDHLYRRNPHSYNNIDPGDLSKQKALREKLQCKSFKWFLETIAPDILNYYPPWYPPDYASGIIRNEGSDNLCLDTFGNINGEMPVRLYPCSYDPINPQITQRWSLSNYQDLRIRDEEECLDAFEKGRNVKIYVSRCHRKGGNQLWQYNVERKWLIHGNGRKCLEADLIEKHAVLNVCDPKNVRMRWTFGVTNETALLTMQTNQGYKKLPRFLKRKINDQIIAPNIL